MIDIPFRLYFLFIACRGRRPGSCRHRHYPHVPRSPRICFPVKKATEMQLCCGSRHVSIRRLLLHIADGEHSPTHYLRQCTHRVIPHDLLMYLIHDFHKTIQFCKAFTLGGLHHQRTVDGERHCGCMIAVIDQSLGNIRFCYAGHLFQPRQSRISSCPTRPLAP